MFSVIDLWSTALSMFWLFLEAQKDPGVEHVYYFRLPTLANIFHDLSG